jgi:CheY-like chemotaxis protein
MASLDEELPDLVCLDVNLPSGNGLSVCEMMETDPAAAKIPVIVLTGCKDAQTIRRCRDMCAYYVNKAGDVWRRVEPVIHELIDISPAPLRENVEDRQRYQK